MWTIYRISDKIETFPSFSQYQMKEAEEEDQAAEEWLKSRLKNRRKKKNESGKKRSSEKKNEVASSSSSTPEKKKTESRTFVATPEDRRRRKKVVRLYNLLKGDCEEFKKSIQMCRRVLGSLQNILDRLKPIRESFADDIRREPLTSFPDLKEKLIYRHVSMAESQRKNLSKLVEQMRFGIKDMQEIVLEIASRVDKYAHKRTPENPVSEQDLSEWSENILNIYNNEFWHTCIFIENINYENAENLKTLVNTWDREFDLKEEWTNTVFAKIFSDSNVEI